MGLISLPIMLRYGYSQQLASGVICASGTLAQIIPPSIVLIVLADVLGAPVGDVYAGAVLPGLLLVALLMGYVLIVSIVNPSAVPALPPEARSARGWPLYRHALLVMVPPLTLIFLVLGSIFMGIATPSEGGAMGAVGALVLALAKRRLNYKMLREALESTTRLSSFVMFILIGSTVFALIFRAVDGDLWVERLFTLVPGGAVGFLIIVNLLIFVLGFFLDFFEIAFILLPLVAPVAAKMGIDPVWFAVMIGMNLQISFLTPPFGFALFYLRSVAPREISTANIYKGIVPFVGIQSLALLIVIAWPALVTGSAGAGTVQAPPGIGIPAAPSQQEDKAAAEIDRLLREDK